jgi:RecA-family ATPase
MSARTVPNVTGFPPVDDAVAADFSAFAPVTAEDLLARSFPPRESIVSPWLAQKSLSMIYARRGAGKTWLVSSIALAAASGGTVFRRAGAGPAWKADRPHKVLLVDGEMPGNQIQKRLAALIAGGKYQTKGNLRILAADLFEDPMPSISGPRGQEIVEAHLSDAGLVIFDNVSTLFRGLDENDAGEWDPVQEWLFSLRRRGLAVVLVHHGGKNGNQRGTSKREDILDNVLALRQPDDYDETEGARVHVVFEKARGITGFDVETFEARLLVKNGSATWETSDLRDETDEEITKLRAAGKSTREIAKKVGLDQSRVVRRLKRMARRDAGGSE